MRGIQKHLSEFRTAGIVPVAVSVDTPDVSLDLAKNAGLTFPLLSDPTTEVIHRYGLLHLKGGPDGQNISRPAEFLIDSNRTVHWTNFTEDVRVRARADEVLQAAKKLP